jgi:hypothetical protein
MKIRTMLGLSLIFAGVSFAALDGDDWTQAAENEIAGISTCAAVQCPNGTLFPGSTIICVSPSYCCAHYSCKAMAVTVGLCCPYNAYCCLTMGSIGPISVCSSTPCGVGPGGHE